MAEKPGIETGIFLPERGCLLDVTVKTRSGDTEDADGDGVSAEQTQANSHDTAKKVKKQQPAGRQEPRRQASVSSNEQEHEERGSSFWWLAVLLLLLLIPLLTVRVLTISELSILSDTSATSSVTVTDSAGGGVACGNLNSRDHGD